jgi:hypothetical protein
MIQAPCGRMQGIKYLLLHWNKDIGQIDLVMFKVSIPESWLFSPQITLKLPLFDTARQKSLIIQTF